MRVEQTACDTCGSYDDVRWWRESTGRGDRYPLCRRCRDEADAEARAEYLAIGHLDDDRKGL